METCPICLNEINVSCAWCQPCPSCATFRAKLDREKLARIVSDETGLSGDWCYDAADAIIAYLKEG